MSSKLEEGDFTGAVRLTASTDSFAECNETTQSHLLSKYPLPHPEAHLAAELDPSCILLIFSQEEVCRAICSFCKVSAPGPNGLRPQHLVYLTSTSAGSGGQSLLQSLVAFANLVMSGKVPPAIREVFFGASLIALRK